MTIEDYGEVIGLLLGSFSVGFGFGYVLAAFKVAAKISTNR
jgi:hypothetical protein